MEERRQVIRNEELREQKRREEFAEYKQETRKYGRKTEGSYKGSRSRKLYDAEE